MRAPVLRRWGPAPAMLAYDTRRPSTPAGYSDKERGEEVRGLVICCMDVAFIARATWIQSAAGMLTRCLGYRPLARSIMGKSADCPCIVFPCRLSTSRRCLALRKRNNWLV